MSGTGATIRGACAADYAALCAAAALCGPAARAALPSGEDFAALTRESPAVVAILGGQIIGYLLTSPLAYDGDAAYTLWLEALAVVPAWRRRDIATALCAALGTAWEAGTRAVLAGGALDGPAAALLARVGFAAYRDGLLLWRLAA